MTWPEQPDRSVAADFLERVADGGGAVSQDARGVWWLERIPEGLTAWYGVVLHAGTPQGPLKKSHEFRPPGIVQGKGERLTLDPRESDVYLAFAFLLDRVEGVSWAADGTVLLDSPYAGGSTARARNFAEQFGLTVTLNDDKRLKPAWELKRPRLGLMDAGAEVTEMLDRYRVPWKKTTAPTKPEFDTVIVGRPGVGAAFVKAGGNVIVAAEYRVPPPGVKKLLHEIYLRSARAV